MNEVQVKVCPKCGIEKPLSEYSKGNGKFGRRSICKECEHQIQNSPEYRERRRLRRAERRRTEPGYAEHEKRRNVLTILNNESSYKRFMLRHAKKRAKARNLEFNITIDDFNIPKLCPLLGIELYLNVGNGRAFDNSPSLDRIDSSKGYIPGNVWVISTKANRIKSDATLEELEKITHNLKVFGKKGL